MSLGGDSLEFFGDIAPALGNQITSQALESIPVPSMPIEGTRAWHGGLPFAWQALASTKQ